MNLKLRQIVHQTKSHLITRATIDRKRCFVISDQKNELVAVYFYKPKEKETTAEKAIMTAIILEETK